MARDRSPRASDVEKRPKGRHMKKRALSIFIMWSLLGTLAGLLSAPSARAQGFDNQDKGQANERPLRFTVTDLGTLGGRNSQANAINNRGQAVGASEITANAARHAVLFDRDGITDLGALPASLVGAAFGINNRGDIFGGSTTEGSSRTGPFHATQFKDGQGIDLGTLGGPTS